MYLFLFFSVSAFLSYLKIFFLSPYCKQQKEWVLKDETFSFVMTESSAQKRWGYCHRVLTSEYPQCFCIISTIPCFSIFSMILKRLTSIHSASSTFFSFPPPPKLPFKSTNQLVWITMLGPSDFIPCLLFLNSIYHRALPPPGERLEVVLPTIPRGPNRKTIKGETMCLQRYVKKYLPPPFLTHSPPHSHTLSLSRPNDSDSLLDHVDFEPLLHYLDPPNIFAAFISLLLERRVIFIADTLGTLSACVQATVAVRTSPLHSTPLVHAHSPIM